ncbi:hypothetical protein LTR35_001916 [Friedmanniomyces endolithicus]|uniref:Phosphoinositide phospholipase C n=1 Tax=Friedmanniomyces endolithicus TaxID=329885 RepID=A0AAN6FXK5_9PEZI|nr:hypothetical protein LTS00_011688 [Friedmanniomyces endolithicus]KAK0291194.1 hypothetical protein LTR35_001916 [Friedmanniomyces endolithicus]KAK0325278.1 hypothetical protein LTR82_003560 [Friedmanniomyces endolithicus]KAK0996924.1 hypothetical protein LTR54_010001 [Friedmanniomyces endolithicus]
MNLPPSVLAISKIGRDGRSSPSATSTPRAPGSESFLAMINTNVAPRSAPTSAPSSGPPSRTTSIGHLFPLKTPSTLGHGSVTASPQTNASPSGPPRSAMSERTMSDRMSERSPSPHTRVPQPGAMAEAMASSRSPGLIRRLSRGAHNKLRRRASTQHSLRMQREQSAGPVLTRRRSDSNGGSEFGGQDVSDLELDSTVEDVAEEQFSPHQLQGRLNALGIDVPRSSDVSTLFEGGVADADPSILQCGTYLIRLTRKKKKRVMYWLDSTSARVCWYGKASVKSFGLDDVVEVRKDLESRNARDDVHVSLEDELRLLTIVYADEQSKGRGTKTIHLLMPDMHVMDQWLKAVNRVVAERVASMKALSLSAEKSDKAMLLLWRQAMQAKGDGAEEFFTIDDAQRFCRQLQINCNTLSVESHFRKANPARKGVLTYQEYRNFVQSFKERKDIVHIFSNLRHGLDSDLDLPDFLAFLKDSQGVNVDKDRAHWETVFDKYARPSQNLRGLWGSEPDTCQKTLSAQGLQSFLSSSYNLPLQPSNNEATLDRPLNEYFISSSHNTYLLGHQVRGTSSVEGYIDSLIRGCRCVEVDCWDGENNRPMVTHGRTMSTRVSFEDCISVIAKYAFHSSPYPLIISLEVHCSPEQQSAMVDIMVKHFDAMMVTEPIMPNVNCLPSPEELRGRILIKVKAADDMDQSQLLVDASNGRSRARSLTSVFTRSPSAEKMYASSPLLSSPGATSPSDPGIGSISTPRGSTTSVPTTTPNSSAEDSDDGSRSVAKVEAPKTSKIIPKLGRLGVYAQGISFPKALGFSDPKAKAANHIFSFSEDTFDSRCKKEEGARQALEKHNVHYLMRVYPGRRRIWSSNFNPMLAWRRGVQMAALNWQTYDVHQQINRAMFAAGSDCLGYVLKPEELRHAKHLAIADTLPEAAEKKNKKGKKIVRFTVHVISAQRLPRPREVNPEAGMNPYIEFELFSADDKATGDAPGESSTDASANDGTSGAISPPRKRTRTIFGNGFDPSFEEHMAMSAVTKHPSLIFVRWTVWHQPDGRKAGSNPVQLATFTAKLGSLQQGYRHLPLYNPQGEKYKEAKLFVRITKEAPVPAFEDEAGDGHAMLSAAAAGVVSPRLGEAGRPDRSWPRRIFSRNPSERRRGGEGPDSRGLLSRTSSMDR